MVVVIRGLAEMGILGGSVYPSDGGEPGFRNSQ
jgi:hypothetical protein